MVQPQVQFKRFGLCTQRMTPLVLHQAWRHLEVECGLVEGGSMAWSFSGRTRTMQPGCLWVFWGIVPHQIVECEAKATLHWITMPLPWFVSLGLSRDMVAAVMGGDCLVEDQPHHAQLHRLHFQQWERDLDLADASGQQAVLLELEATLRRLAQVTVATSSETAEPGIALDVVTRLASCMAQEFDQPLTVVDIAQRVGLNSRYATTLFKQATGMSLSQCLRMVRLSHAQHLLATTDHPIQVIAMRAGFSSLSRFYEACARQWQGPPGMIRQALRHARSSTTPETSDRP